MGRAVLVLGLAVLGTMALWVSALGAGPRAQKVAHVIVSHVRAHEATVKATVDAGVAEASYQVQLDPPEGCGNKEPCEPRAVLGEGSVAPGKTAVVEVEAVRLEPRTLYVVTVVVSGAGGTMHKTRSFTTRRGAYLE